MKGVGRHVAPERWGDLAAGRLSDAETMRLMVHAAQCPRCQRARERVRSAHAAMAAIARTPAPELGWDHVRARVYWTVSSERRAQQRRPSRRWLPMSLGAVALAGAAAAVLAVHAQPDAQPLPVASVYADARATLRVRTPATVATPVELVPGALTGVVTLSSGEVDIDGVTVDVLGHAVGAGSVVRTASGRVGVQFGAGSAFAVGDGSTVAVRRFDGAAIELAVHGEISVEVSHRAPGQRFLVVAGSRTVEVRGTAFRVVHRDRALEVACSHGRVAVSDAGGEVEVGAGASLAISDGEPLLGRRPAALDGAALSELSASLAPRLPVWTDAAGLYRTSGPLVIGAAHGRAVRIDGVEVGRGPMTLRVMSGRHLVETSRGHGRWTTGEWVEVAGETGTRVDIEDVVAVRTPARTPSSPTGSAARRAQLEAGLDSGRVATCLRALTKQGITDTFVELGIGVDATGAVSFLNILETDLPRSTAACVRDAVSAVNYPRGAAASWRQRLTF